MRLWLVSGGVGFIGYHVTRALLARGDRVRVVDDFSNAPYPTVMKRRNAADLAAEFSADVLGVTEGCITHRALVATLMEGVHGVVHLAGLAGVRPSFVDPARYAKVNVEGSATLLEAAQREGTEVFAFASSSSVYGNATPLPAVEEAAAVRHESPYASTKRGAEMILASMLKKTPRMRAPSLRFFTVYGPRQRPEMAITAFLKEILADRPITLFGDGSMRRDFTHVDDITRGVLASLERAPEGSRAYNLGSGAPITLADLVAAMGRAAGKTPTVTHAPVPLGDVDATFASIARARDELGWSPRVSLEEGLASVVAWLKTPAS